MIDVLVVLYCIIALVVAVGVYVKSPPGWRGALVGASVGAIWPMMILVLLTGEDRGI